VGGRCKQVGSQVCFRQITRHASIDWTLHWTLQILVLSAIPILTVVIHSLLQESQHIDSLETIVGLCGVLPSKLRSHAVWKLRISFLHYICYLQYNKLVVELPCLQLYYRQSFASNPSCWISACRQPLLRLEGSSSVQQAEHHVPASDCCTLIAGGALKLAAQSLRRVRPASCREHRGPGDVALVLSKFEGFVDCHNWTFPCLLQVAC
jgi:hypothetical protein